MDGGPRSRLKGDLGVAASKATHRAIAPLHEVQLGSFDEEDGEEDSP